MKTKITKQDLEAIAAFNRIVKNYIKMLKIKNNGLERN
jgi:hypothetical protein